MPDKDHSSHGSKNLTKDAEKESRSVADSSKNLSAALLETLKQEGGEEASSDARDALESRSLDHAHRERMAVIEREERERKMLVRMFFWIVVILVVFLATVTVVMPFLVEDYNQNIAIVPSIIFMIGNLMGYVFGRGIR